MSRFLHPVVQTAPGRPPSRALAPGQLLIAVLSLLVLLGGGAFAWARTISSPAQAVADAAAPTPSVLTAEVTEQVLVRESRFRGDLQLGDRFDVALSAPDGEPGVVTGVGVSAGEQVQPAALLAAVNGVPTVACPGPFPLYRSITPQLRGPDVEMLRACLAAAGYLEEVEPVDIFDRSSQDAAQRLFLAHGYDLAQTIAPDAQAEAEAADEAVTSAEQAVTVATDELEAAREADDAAGAGESIASLEQQFVGASRALEQARDDRQEARSRVGPEVQPSMIRVIPSLPRVVSAVGVRVGDQVGDDSQPSFGLASQAAQLEAEVDETTPGIAELAAGAEVRIEASGQSFAATVTSIEDLGGGDPAADGQVDPPDEAGSAQPRRRRIVAALGDQVPATLLGSNVLVTAQLAASQGPVLAVPITALQSDGRGQAYVQVRAGDVDPADTRSRRVDVQVGLDVDGLVEITPVDGQLAPGDLVVLGVS